MRSNWVVSANLSAVSANPGAVMVITHGAASIPITVTIARARVSNPETYETNTRVASSPCLLLYSARIGTNACEKAPSAKIRRSRLGSLKATKKASVAIPAPKMRATIASRAKPSTRENMVIELTAASDFKRFITLLFQTLE